MTSEREKELCKNIYPGIEFEGPQGFFWDLDNVPIESLSKAVKKLIDVGEKRGFSLDMMLKIAEGDLGGT